MPFIANTPESLLARSDSKNPATTCRGVTSTGRPCRRPLAASDTASTQGSHHLHPQRGTKPCRSHHDDPANERLYCWQHREQASSSAHSSPGRRASSTATTVPSARSSIDTLADRLQMLNVDADRNEKHRQPAPKGRKKPRPRPDAQRRGIISTLFLCCFIPPSEEALSPPPRPKPQPPPTSPPSSSPKTSRPQTRLPPAASRAAQYRSLIPATVVPQAASALMAELTKPVSQMDEPGYIYMFWMTPESQQVTPPTDAARSLLAPVLRPTAGIGQRRASDVVASFAAGGRGSSRQKGSARNSGGCGDEQPTILLKIGRANNIQRRLNEWKRQCGYNISLVRYYPYIPSSSNSSSHASPTAGLVPRRMPHSHKVERLVHLELAGMGLHVADSDRCSACGRGHREWFRVEETRSAIAAVDEVIRRWSDWDEGRW